MAISVVAAIGVLGLHLTGMLPGNIGYASEEQVQVVVGRMDRLDRRYLQGQIMDTRIRQCQALKDNNQSARVYWLENLNELLLEFERLTGKAYRLPGCDEI